MTIEEKRNRVFEFCRNRDIGKGCIDCPLVQPLGRYDYHVNRDIGGSKSSCFTIADASEKDLDTALSIIGYKESDTPTDMTDTPTDTPTDLIRALSPEQQRVCADVIKFYGYDMQRMVAIEEMSELTKELSKQKRGRDNKDQIIEEMADVYICLEQLAIMNDISQYELDEWIRKKIDRIRKKLIDNTP